MRKLIAGMKMSVDEKIEGPDGCADWVDAWSDEYDVTPRVDACVLGGGAAARQGHLSCRGCSNHREPHRRGLVDELRLIVHPLIAGKGKALFATTELRRGLELRSVQQLQGRRVALTHGIT